MALSKETQEALDELRADMEKGFKVIEDNITAKVAEFSDKAMKAIESKATGVEATVEPVKTPTTPTAKFEVEDKTYVFTVPHFNFKGKVITSEAALGQPELLKELVSIGAGVIERVATV